ncbi:MAG: tetratricopeptide repeat protein [Muribaculaceae bacterium]|nr:tetratricopeptide repeat protein [Muribaculaceae bacterium]
MRNRILSILLCLCSVATIAAAGNNLAVEADSAYNAKDYEKAIVLYTELRQEEGSNTALLYNLGNAYCQEGDYGKAMVCYLRAHRLDPSDGMINTNLQYLQSKVDDANKAAQKGKRLKVTPDEQSFFQSVRTALAVDTSTDVWAVWGVVTFILFVGAVALYIFSRNVTARKIGFFGGMVCIVLSFLFVCFAFMGAKSFTSRDEAVIVAFKTTLATEPGKIPEGEKGNTLTRGSVVRILSEETDAEGNVSWYKVRLNSDYIGWVKADEVEKV